MYSSEIEINKSEFRGILDFYVLRKVQEDLKQYGYEYKIHELFESISDIEKINMYTITSIILFSVSRYEKINKKIIETEFIEDKRDIEKFSGIFQYINELLEKCMPLKQIEDDDLFEEFEDEKDKKDWDFDYMEYLWYSVLKRTDDFYKITPKVFFSQMSIWKKVNNVKEEKVQYL